MKRPRFGIPKHFTIYMSYFDGFGLEKIAGTLDFSSDGFEKWNRVCCELANAVPVFMV